MHTHLHPERNMSIIDSRRGNHAIEHLLHFWFFGSKTKVAHLLITLRLVQHSIRFTSSFGVFFEREREKEHWYCYWQQKACLLHYLLLVAFVPYIVPTYDGWLLCSMCRAFAFENPFFCPRRCASFISSYEKFLFEARVKSKIDFSICFNIFCIWCC